MPSVHIVVSGIKFAPWTLAGLMLLGADASVTAQEAPVAPLAFVVESAAMPVELLSATAEGHGGGTTTSTMPSTGAEPVLATTGIGALSLGALVGAGVAAIYALREKFKER